VLALDANHCVGHLVPGVEKRGLEPVTQQAIQQTSNEERRREGYRQRQEDVWQRKLDPQLRQTTPDRGSLVRCLPARADCLEQVF
jgi:hypothetical protein